jgi:hypothetical protein
MVDFLSRDRWPNLARPLRFGQGIKFPRQPNFTLKMYPIKQIRHSIARRNPTTPEHQDVEYGFEVGWTWWICFIAPSGFVGGHGRMRMQSTYHDVKNEFSTLLLYLLAGGCGDVCNESQNHTIRPPFQYYEEWIPGSWARCDPPISRKDCGNNDCAKSSRKKMKIKNSVSN